MSNMSVVLFKGNEAYTSGRFGWTVKTGQCVIMPLDHAEHLMEKFPGDWEIVNEDGDAVLAEEIVKVGEPFDGMPVDEEEEPENEEPESEETAPPADELADDPELGDELLKVFEDPADE